MQLIKILKRSISGVWLFRDKLYEQSVIVLLERKVKRTTSDQKHSAPAALCHIENSFA